MGFTLHGVYCCIVVVQLELGETGFENSRTFTAAYQPLGNTVISELLQIFGNGTDKT